MPLYAHTNYDDDKRKLALKPDVQYSLMICRDLEDELSEFCRVIPLEKDHLDVYSTKLWGIILRACAEIDSQLHALVEDIEGRSVKRNIGDYIKREPLFQLSDFSLLTKFGNIQLIPFQSFQSSASPIWWNDYNAVKHRRLGSIKSATLKNAINAVGALYIVLLRQYGEYLFPRRLTTINGRKIVESASDFFAILKTPWY